MSDGKEAPHTERGQDSSPRTEHGGREEQSGPRAEHTRTEEQPAPHSEHGRTGEPTSRTDPQTGAHEQAPHQANTGHVEDTTARTEHQTAAPEITPARDTPPATPDPTTPDPADLVQRARSERPVVDGDIDGTAVRKAIIDQLGLKDTDRVLREAVETHFSDENLKAHFHRAADGGVVVDLGVKTRQAPQVKIEVVGVGSGRDVQPKATDFANKRTRTPSEQSVTSERSPIMADARNFRVPTPFVNVTLRLAGLFNQPSTSMAAKLSRSLKTEVTETGLRAERSVHDVTFKLTVREPRKWPWLKGQTKTDAVSVDVPLVWPRREVAEAPSQPVRPELRPRDIAQVEINGLHKIYNEVERALAKTEHFPVGHPGARRFRDWLATLPDRGTELLTGEPVRETFKLPGRRERVEVSIAVVDAQAVRPKETVDGRIVRTRDTSYEATSGQSVSLRWGGGLFVQAGDITGALGGGAGPLLYKYATTTTGSKTTAKGRQEVTSTYTGPVETQQVRFSYVVQAGSHRFKIDADGTVWSKPEGAVEEPVRHTAEPETHAVPETVDLDRALHQLDVIHTLPEETVAGIVGPTLHRLWVEGVVRSKDLGPFEQRLRQFVHDHAREIGRGEPVRLPVSSWAGDAPDVFVTTRPVTVEARYVGVVPGETAKTVTSVSRKESVDLAKSWDTTGGVSGYVFDGRVKNYKAGNAYIYGKHSTKNVESLTHEVGVERRFDGEKPLHRTSYPIEIEVALGDRWAANGEKVHTFRGEADVLVPERPAPVPDDTTRHRRDSVDEETAPRWEKIDDTAGWRAASRMGTHRAAYLPPVFQLDSLKPVPDLVPTVARMVDEEPGNKVAGWGRRVLFGNRPANIDQHKANNLAGADLNTPDERTAAREALEAFAELPARAGRFDRTAVFKDSVELRTYNRPGLLGDRERVVRVDLSADLTNPRVLSVDTTHQFSTSEVVEHGQTADRQKGTGFEVGVGAVDVPPLGHKFTSAVAAGGGGAGHMSRHGATEGTGVKESVVHTRTERAYLVAFDATYDVHTSKRQRWHDFLGGQHDGRSTSDAMRVHVPDAATAWIPASEIHQIGLLRDADLEHLLPEEVKAYRRTNEGETDSSPDRRSDDSGAGEEQSPRQDSTDLDVAAPSNVGRGSGRVELHRLEAGKELLFQISSRIDEWSIEQGARSVPASVVELAQEVLTSPRTDLVSRGAGDFGSLNDRLVNDVLGPTLTGAEFGPALRSMLNGGLPVFLPAINVFGRVEQLVVLRANLGPGEFHRAAFDETVEAQTAATRSSGSSTSSTWAMDWALGGQVGMGKKGLPAGGFGLSVGGFGDTGTTRTVTHEHGETVTAKRSLDAVEFLHDLHVTMDVYNYSRATKFRRLFPGGTWYEKPWSTDFTLPAAVRSVVPKDETVPVDGQQTPAQREATGSLTEWQQAQELPAGLKEQTPLHVRPFDSPALQEALDVLARGDGERPVLHPRAIHQLQAATGSLPLRAHIRDLLAGQPYTVKITSDAVRQVDITADVVKRELIGPVRTELTTKVSDTDTTKVSTTTNVQTGLMPAASASAVHLDNAQQRPGINVIENFMKAVDYKSSAEQTVKTTKETSSSDGDGQPARGDERYLVRLTPQWTVTPTFRSSKAPEAWTEPVRTAVDSPIVVETDRAGLEQLGLADPTPPAADPRPRKSLIDFLNEPIEENSAGQHRTIADFLGEPADASPRRADEATGTSGLDTIDEGDESVLTPAERDAAPVRGTVAELDRMTWTDQRPFGVDPSGEIRHFEPGEVRVRPLTARNGQEIGLTFLSGKDGARSLKWAQAPAESHLRGYVHPETSSAFPGLRGAERIVSPWRADSTYVAVGGGEHHFELRLGDGTPLRVDGTTFAEVLSGLDSFRRLSENNAAASLVLLSGRSGSLDGPGGAARDFERGLRTAALDHLVVAPTTDVHLRGPLFAGAGALLDRGGETVLDRGGSWRAFPTPDVVENSVLPAVIGDSRVPTTFRTGDVRATGLHRADGTPVGVAFTVGSELRHDAGAVASVPTGTTRRYEAGHPAQEGLDAAEAGGRGRSETAPWPVNSSYVIAHGEGGVVRLDLVDGRTVQVDGETFGRVLHDLKAFRDGTAGTEALALISCDTGVIPRQGGVGHDLQRALNQFGHRQPVVAPTREVGTWRWNDGTWETWIADAGTWERFASDDARQLGVRTADGEWTSFTPADVRSTPVVRDDGSPAGVSFRPEGAATPAGRAFTVDVESTSDGWLTVHTTDGTALSVDGPTFARLVAQSEPFRTAMGDGEQVPLALVPSTAAEVPSQRQAFQDTLRREFGFRETVYEMPVARDETETVPGTSTRAGGAGDAGRPGGVAEPDLPAAERTDVSGESPDRTPARLETIDEGDESALPVADREAAPVRGTAAELDRMTWIDERLAGVDLHGEIRRFEPGEVSVQPISRRGQQIGLTFLSGDEAVRSLEWGEKPSASHLRSYLHPDTSSAFPSRRGAERFDSPWHPDSTYVAVRGSETSFELRLADGTRVRVDGATFADVLTGLDAFRQLAQANPAASLVLLSGRSGSLDVPGGAARDLERGLAGAAMDHLVVAPTADVHLRTARFGRGGELVLDRGGSWRAFPLPDVIENLELSGVRTDGTPVTFRTAEVRTRAVTGPDGTNMGTAFVVGPELGPIRGVERDPYLNRTFLYDEGFPGNGNSRPDGTPPGRYEVPSWPADSAHLFTHGTERTMYVELTDGRIAEVTGETFAHVVNDLRPFRRLLADRQPGAILLMACDTGAVLGTGGAAHDFQRALAEFGHHQPVVAPTRPVGIHGWSGRGWETRVKDGGTWERFSAAPAHVLGEFISPGGTGRWDSFAPDAVRSEPVVRDGRVVGVSFRPEGSVLEATGGRIADGGVPERAFAVDVESSSDGWYVVQTSRGDSVFVDGPAFARVVAESEAFRGADEAPIALVTSTPLDRPGEGAAFHEALVRDFGFREPVFEPRGAVEVVEGVDGTPVVQAEDGWRAHDESGTPLSEDVPWADERPQGVDLAGEVRRFEAGEVRVREMLHDGRPVGLTFLSGSEQAASLRWGSAPESEHLRTFMHPEGSSSFPSRRGATEMAGPWRQDAMYVAVRGAGDSFELRLGDGAPVRVDGATFGQVVAELRPFRDLTRDNAGGSLVLLAGRSGEGTAARDFQQALAAHGWDHLVVAPTADVHLRTPLLGRGGQLVVDQGGSWRAFPLPDVVEDRVLPALTTRREPTEFRTSHVRVTGVVDPQGRPVAVTFGIGAELRADVSYLRRPDGGTTLLLPEGDHGQRVEQDFDEGRDASQPAPWPERSAYVTLHGFPSHAFLELNDGRKVGVTGGVLAEVLHNLQVFRDLMSAREQEALTLLSCSTGAVRAAGGVADDFQRALAEFGYHQPVVAPTKPVYLHTLRRTVWETFVEDGGRWEQFSSGQAPALGRLSGDGWVPFTPAEVRSAPVLRDGQVAGVSFRDGGAAWGETGGRFTDPVPERAFVVDVEPAGDGEFVVRTSRGDAVFVDGPVLARVVGESEAFRGAERAPVVLALSEPVDVSGQVRGFHDTLVRDYGLRESVFESRGGIEVVAGADGTQVLRAGDGWAEHPTTDGGVSRDSAGEGTGVPSSPDRTSDADAEITLADADGQRPVDRTGDDGENTPSEAGTEQSHPDEFEQVPPPQPPPWVDRRPMGVDVNGEVRRFEPGEVRVSRMWRRTDPMGLWDHNPVGLTFLSGSERSASLRWGAEPRDSHLRTFVHQEGSTSFPHRAGATETGVPWRRDAMYVAVRAESGTFELRLRDGSRLGVDGSTFGRVTTELSKFRHMVSHNQSGTVVLLAGRSGVGVAAGDFQRAMAAQGWHQLVVAPTADVHLRTDWPGRGGQIVVDRGGAWRAFPEAEAVRNLEIEAETGHGRPTSFRTSEVRITSINGPDGKPQAITFQIGVDQRFGLKSLSRPHEGTTGLLPEGVRSLSEARRAMRAGRMDVQLAPWPEQSAYVNIHGSPETVAVELTDGRTVSVRGEAFADLLLDLRAFRDLMAVREQEALTLLSCSVAAERRTGGFAHDFQRALAQAGHRQPVVAPTRVLITHTHHEGVWGSQVEDGGRWEQFSSGGAVTLGNLVDDARWVPFEPGEVRSTPIVHGDRTVGVSFRRDGAVEAAPVDGRAKRFPERTFHVSAESDVDGRIVVYTADDRPVHLDGRTFARVVADSETFRGMGRLRSGDLLALVVSTPPEGPTQGRAFHDTLRREFFVENPVHEPRGAAGLRDGADGPAVWTQDGWTVYNHNDNLTVRVIPGGADTTLRGVTLSGDVRRFEAGEVQVRRMWRQTNPLGLFSEPVGLTFLTGASRDISLQWGAQPRSTHLQTLVHPMPSPLGTRGEPSQAAAPWREDATYVAARGDRDYFELTLKDGTPLRVDGSTFGHVMTQLDKFGQVVDRTESRTLVLLTNWSGAGEAARDFQQALAAAGRSERVMAPTTAVHLRTDAAQAGQIVVSHGGTWRAFPVADAVPARTYGFGRLRGVDATGDVRRFEPVEVQVRPMTRSGDQVGLTFLSGGERSASLRWAREPGNEHLRTFMHPEGSSSFPSSKGAEKAAGPWREDSMYVAVRGGEDAFDLWLSDDARVRVDGSTFGRLMAELAPFRAMTEHNDGGTLVLLAGRSGGGAAARDFQQALAAQGWDHLVVAPTAGVHLRTAWLQRGGQIVVDRGGSWRPFPLPDVVVDRSLPALTMKSEPTVFRTGEVRVARIDDRQGGPVAVTFMTGPLLRTDQQMLSRPHDGTAWLLPEGDRGESFDQDVAGGRVASQPAPWPERSAYVTVHGRSHLVGLDLTDGRKVLVGGRVLAEVLHDLQAFRDLMSAREQEALTLVSCEVGARRGAGGVADDFQRAMVELGYHQPVVAPTKSTALYEWRRNTWDTYTIDGGRWEQFSSGSATALGRVEDRWVPFAPAEVRSAPVLRDGRVVGVSFREDGSAWAATGGRVADDSVPERAFVVDVEPGAANEFAVRTTRGDMVFVDGPVLARVVGESEAFRGAERAPVVLAVSQPVDVSGQVRGFYQTLIRDFGFRDSVFESRGGVEVVTGADGTPALRAGDGWAEHRAASLASADGTPHAPEARVDAEITPSDAPAGHRRLDGPEQAPVRVDQRPVGVDLNGEVRRFEPGEVQVRPLVRGGEQVGLTFLSGGERSASLRWAGEPRSEHLRTFMHPEGSSSFPSSKGAAEVRGPWRTDSTYVAVRGGTDSFELRLTDGSRVAVDGSTFGRVMSELTPFRTMADAPNGGTLVLLAGRSAAGAAARDFQQGLASAGWHQLVVAPTADVHLRTALLKRGGQIVVDGGGSWRTFPEPEVIANRQLEAESSYGASTIIRTGDVRVTALNGHDGRPLAVSFLVGDELHHHVQRLALPATHRTSLVPEGVDGARFVQEMKAGRDISQPSPWPDRSAYVITHGFPEKVQLELVDGRTVMLRGAEFADLLGDLRAFGDLMAARDPEALTLLACSTGEMRGGGGLAHDFQRALAGQGHRQPVVAPTNTAGTYSVTRDAWSTHVLDGRWETFSSGPASVLGQLHDEARWVPVDPGAVRSRPIMQGDRPVGVSFWQDNAGDAGHPQARTARLREGTFHVAAESDVDGRLVVHTTDGRTVHVDGAAFARMVGNSETFRAVDGFRQPIVLAASTPLNGRTPGADFHQTLRGEFGVTTPVLELRGAAGLHADGRSRPVVWFQDGWTVHDRDAAVPAQVVRPPAPGVRADGLTSLPGSESGLGRLEGTEPSGHVRRFEPGDVRVEQLRGRSKEPIGFTFLTGAERSASLRWGAEPGIEHLRTFVQPEGSSSFPSSKGAMTVPANWRQDSMYVAVRGGADSFELRLIDGAQVRVDGSTLGRVMSELPKFQRMAETNAGGSVVLLAGRSGAGRAAADFQQALTAQGWPHLVVAPTTDVHLRTAWFKRAGQVVVDQGGSWRTFPTAEVVENRALRARTLRGQHTYFTTDEVRVTSINGPDGRPQAVSFVVGGELLQDLNTFAQPHRGRTTLLPDGEAGRRVEQEINEGADFSQPAPWPEPAAYITAHSNRGIARIELTDGHSLLVGGAVLAELVHDLRPFRDLMAAREHEALTLLSCWAGADRHAGGTAFDFQQALERLGYRQPVAGPTGPVRFGLDVPGTSWESFVSRGGHWESFPSPWEWSSNRHADEAGLVPSASGRDRDRDLTLSSARALGDDAGLAEGRPAFPELQALPQGVDADGRVREFDHGDVQVQELTRWGKPVGLTFLTGADQAASLSWAGAPRSEHLRTFVHPEGDGPSAFPSSDGARPVAGRWREDSLYVAVKGSADGFELRLTDGSPVRVDGSNFGLLLGGLDKFQEMTYANEGGSVVLLAGRTGLGDAAADFQRALSYEGLHHLVVAPTADVHLQTGSWQRNGGQLVLDRGGAWRTFPETPVVDGMSLPATLNGRPTRFDTSQVRANLLLDHDGAPLAMTFLVGADLQEYVHQLSHPHRGTTVTVQAGESVRSRVQQEVRAGADSSKPAPWPERSAYVVLHGDQHSVDIPLTDGRVVDATGDVLAMVLQDLRPFHQLMAGRDPEALTLLSCETGGTREPGGVARDFQRALTQLGHRQPVVAPTVSTGTHLNRGGVWESYLKGRGRWEHFSSGPARALGRLADDTRWVSFDPAAVRSAPLVREGRTIGLSFWEGTESAPKPGHGAAPGVRLSSRTFVVSAQSAVDGSLVVHAADGRTVHVDGRTFARVVGNTEVFRGAADQPVVLLTSTPLKTSQGRGFHDVLLREFGAQEPVYAPKGAARLLSAEDGAPVVWSQNGWKVYDVAAVEPGRGTRPAEVADLPAGDRDLTRPSGPAPRVAHGLGADGQPRRFLPAEVRVDELRHAGRPIGLTFLTGDDRASSLSWAEQPARHHLVTYVHPEGAGPSRFPGSEGAHSTTSPWHQDAMYLAVRGGSEAFELRLSDGAGLRVDGTTFGRVVADLSTFRDMTLENKSGTVVLLAARSGLGSAAEGFQRALADVGLEHLVVAPTTDVHLRAGVFAGTGGQLVLDRGGAWRAVPRPDVVAGVTLTAQTRGGMPTPFRTGDVRVTVIRGRDGAPAGLTFLVGKEVFTNLSQMSERHRGTTMTLAPAEEVRTRLIREERTGEPGTTAPWPERSAYVVLHGGPTSATINLVDGRSISAGGETLATVLHDLRAFHVLMSDRRAEALTLFSCQTAATRGPGAFADDFQRTLAGFGHRQPVVAPTTNSGVHTMRLERTWESYLRDDGRWEQFSSGRALALGRVPDGSRWVSFDPAAVRSAPLVLAGRVAGVAFWEHGVQPPVPVAVRGAVMPPHTFHVAARSDVDGLVVLHTNDGKTVHVDGRTFARVVGNAQVFRGDSGTGPRRRIALITSSPLDTPSQGGGFRDTLAGEFGVRVPVYEPRGVARLLTGPDGTPLVGTQDGWTLHDRTPGTPGRAVRPVDAPRGGRSDGDFTQSISLADFLGGTPPREEDR